MLLEHDDIEFVEEQETGSDESMAFPLAPLKLSDLNAYVFPLLFAQQCYSSIVPWSRSGAVLSAFIGKPVTECLLVIQSDFLNLEPSCLFGN